MRLGGPLFVDYQDPEGWVAAVQGWGYRAASCPVGSDADSSTIRAYEQAALAADIVIAEVGVWNNPLSPDEEERRAAVDKNIAGNVAKMPPYTGPPSFPMNTAKTMTDPPNSARYMTWDEVN